MKSPMPFGKLSPDIISKMPIEILLLHNQKFSIPTRRRTLGNNKEALRIIHDSLNIRNF